MNVERIRYPIPPILARELADRSQAETQHTIDVDAVSFEGQRKKRQRYPEQEKPLDQENEKAKPETKEEERGDVNNNHIDLVV